ncbi:MAG: HepT-like ribonuclease domain-containing protein [Rickettsiales bacterium]
MPRKIDPDLIRLKDVLNAIADIDEFITKSSFSERMTLMAVAYEIAIIGEACGKLSEGIYATYPEIPWSDIIGMRHRIIHGYGNVSVERLQEVVNKHLPILKTQIEQILLELTNK